MNDRVAISIARYALVSFVLSLIVFFVSAAADVMGTYGFTEMLIPPGYPTERIIAAVVLLSLTTAIQFGAGSMSYDAGSVAYVTGLGAIFRLLGASEQNRVGFIAHSVGQFNLVHARWGGPAWFIALFWPSLIFDGVTDYIYLSSTVFVKFALIALVSSMLMEQSAIIVSVLYTMIQEGHRAGKAAKERAGGAMGFKGAR